MKKIVLIALLLMSFMGFSQDNSLGMNSLVLFNRTNAERNAYNSVPGRTRFVFNTDTGQLEYKNGTGPWNSIVLDSIYSDKVYLHDTFDYWTYNHLQGALNQIGYTLNDLNSRLGSLYSDEIYLHDNNDYWTYDNLQGALNQIGAAIIDKPVAYLDEEQTFTGVNFFEGNTTFSGNFTLNKPLQQSIGNNNTFLGFATGEDWTSGTYNTYLGSNAGRRLTVGSENVGIGYMSLFTSTNSIRNTAVGVQAMELGSNPTNSVAIGYQSLNKSTGSNNVAVGMHSLLHNEFGSDNVAIGMGAGQFDQTISDITSSELSVFIGHESNPLVNGGTNEIVIGSETFGNGSNTVTIGNDNIIDTYLKGNVQGDASEMTVDASAFNGNLNTSDDTLQEIADVVDDLAGGVGTDDQTLTEVLSQGNDAGGVKITNLADPTLAQDAATKAYVDANIGGGGSSLPVDDTTALVQDPSDNTKQVRIDAENVGTGSTAVLSVSDDNQFQDTFNVKTQGLSNNGSIGFVKNDGVTPIGGLSGFGDTDKVEIVNSISGESFSIDGSGDYNLSGFAGGGNLALAVDNNGDIYTTTIGAGTIQSDTTGLGSTAYKPISNFIMWDYSISTTEPTLGANEYAIQIKAPANIAVDETMDGSKHQQKLIYDDRTADVATIEFSNLELGQEIIIYFNRTALPTFSGATMKEIPTGSETFQANTETVLYGFVNPDGEIDYTIKELTP